MTPIDTHEKALAIAETALNHKASELRILKVTPHIDYTDYFVIMSASSTRQAKALADAVLEAHHGPPLSQVEGYSLGEWVLVDLGDVVVHVFLDDAREYYKFDKLWAHATEVPHDEGSSSKTHSASGTHTHL